MVARTAYGSDQLTCDCSTQRALQVTVTTLMRNPTFRAPLLDVPNKVARFPFSEKNFIIANIFSIISVGVVKF